MIKLLIFDDYGEPTLHKKLPDMIKYAKDKNVAETIRLVTNGTLLNPTLNPKLIDAGLDQIKISLEAVDEDNYKKISGHSIDMEILLVILKIYMIIKKIF